MIEERKPEFSQCFGDKAAPEELTEADILNTVEFDETGDLLATGDRGGRIVVFQKADDHKQLMSTGRTKEYCKYKFYAEFQSHSSEFDYLKSLEIEEKINQIKWCKNTCGSEFLLSSNDQTVKLWKLYDKHLKQKETEQRLQEQYIDAGCGGEAYRNNSSANIYGDNFLSRSRIPRQEPNTIMTTPRRVFANAHAYHINAISVNSDGENFLSADDLRINLWNLEIQDRSFNVVDIKPANMEELNEVITSASFHPKHCNILMYSSSRGTTKIADLRDRALCESYTKCLEVEEDPNSNNSFLSEIISSISDAKFTPCGRYVISRDYLTVKVWDLHMESKPVSVINLNGHLRQHLCDLYESDCIFDKFEVAISGCGNYMLTGSYNNIAHVYDRSGKFSSNVQVSRIIPKSRKLNKHGSVKNARKSRTEDPEVIDFDKKVLHVAWHPTKDVVVVTGVNKLYFYTV